MSSSVFITIVSRSSDLKDIEWIDLKEVEARVSHSVKSDSLQPHGL